MRDRTKKSTFYISVNGQPSWAFEFTSEHMQDVVSGSPPYPPKPLYHFKYTDFQNGVYADNGHTAYSVTNGAHGHDVVMPYVASRIPMNVPVLPPFSRNNDFEIIPFIMEWDGALEVLSGKIGKDLASDAGLAAYSFGIVPFINDVKGIIESLRDIYNGLPTKTFTETLFKRWSFKFEGRAYGAGGYCPFTCEGSHQMKGTATWTPPAKNERALKKLQFLLDEIGFHPDAKTVWDLTPFSFVADYFVPIGDILESMNPRGWLGMSFLFTGMYTTKYTVSYRAHVGSGWPDSSGSPATYEVFQRRPVTNMVVESSSPPAEWPSLGDFKPEFKVKDVLMALYVAYISQNIFRPTQR